MTKVTSNIKISETKVKARVTLSSDKVEIGTLESKKAQWTLLRNIVDFPDLVSCALSPFETLKMFYNGEAWIIEAEAIIDDPQGLINARSTTNIEF